MEHYLAQLHELESDIDRKLDRLERVADRIDNKISKLELQLFCGVAFVTWLVVLSH